MLERKSGVDCRIGYGGIIGRAENIAFVKILRLPVVPVSQVVFDEYDLLGLVDTQQVVNNHSLPPQYTASVIIDHHPLREETMNTPYADVGGDFYGARLDRTDTLNGFEESSYEITPEVGGWLGEHGRLDARFSLFRLQSDVDGKTLSPDNDDHFLRYGLALGWDTRDSWRFPRRRARGPTAFRWSTPPASI